MSNDKLATLQKELEKKSISYKLNEPLSRYTTYRIGGPATILSIVKTKEELINAIRCAKKASADFQILGGGSNVLISDKGLDKLVIINKAERIDLLDNIKEDDKKGNQSKVESKKFTARLKQINTKKYYSFEDLDYKEKGERVLVQIDSGTNLTKAILELIKLQITGLQWYAGIPGTIGGAIYNNIHGGTHLLSEVIEKVEILDLATLDIKLLTNQECNFKYDYSRFHESNEIILSGIFKLFRGDSNKALWVFREWTKRKIIQPKNSAGSIWQNLDSKTQAKLKLESGSWGYIIDKILGLKGTKINDAQISTKHAGFIENLGQAKATDVYKLIQLIRKKAKEKLGITPKLEIVLLGEFTDN